MSTPQDKAPIEAPLLTEAALAERWNISARTLKRWRAQGGDRVPAYIKNGRKGGYGQGVMYRLDDIIKFEDSRKENSNAD